MRRVESSFKNTSAKAERINNSTSRPKRLCDSYFKLLNNDMIFVEEVVGVANGSSGPSTSTSLLNWQKAIKAEDSLLKINIFVSDFLVNTSGTTIDADFAVRVDKTLKLGALKEMIAEKLSGLCGEAVKPEEIVVKRKNIAR